MKFPESELSASVIDILKIIGPESSISAAGMAKIILKLHIDYADGKMASLELMETSIIRKASEWIEDVQNLFDLTQTHFPSEMKETISFPSEREGEMEETTLSWQLLLIGLCLLESRLYEQFERTKAFDALVNELHEPLSVILTERGRALLPRSPPTELPDSVPLWPDDPLKKTEDDLLGRAAFARFLAKRIEAVPLESGAYAIHVYGPWGAGKSTLLNFLHKELEQTNKWLVVEFNAWQHQHIQPPWWSLMERVFEETKSNLSYWETFQEYWWRFNTGRMQYFIGISLLAWLLALVVFPLFQSHAINSSTLVSLAAGAENISKILALITTIWGGILAINHSLLLGDAKAAQLYTELTHDPTNEIKRRFAGLIDKILPLRVAILIDDLDRCQSRYVVDLLEGIQTLFREAPVVCVVAADRHWLNACYEEVYEKLDLRVHEPGKPLGTLFLEKAFRFSTPMPRIPEKLKESYWQHLLQLSASQANVNMLDTLKMARDQVSKAQSEGDVRLLVNSSTNRSFPEQRAIREEAVIRLASPDILERLEHTLKPYASLLEPNPRAMKLLVNSYSANRALAILSEVDLELHQLALWTILCSRWPQLADYLVEHPDTLDKIGKQGAKGIPDGLKELCCAREVIRLVKGGSAFSPLSPDTLSKCAYTR